MNCGSGSIPATSLRPAAGNRGRGGRRFVAGERHDRGLPVEARGQQDRVLRPEPPDRDRVGPEHVGIGSDYVFDKDDLNRELTENPGIFPESYRRWGRMDFVAPDQLAYLPDELTQLGYSSGDIENIMGGNFLRIAREVWK